MDQNAEDITYLPTPRKVHVSLTGTDRKEKKRICVLTWSARITLFHLHQPWNTPDGRTVHRVCKYMCACMHTCIVHYSTLMVGMLRHAHQQRRPVRETRREGFCVGLRQLPKESCEMGSIGEFPSEDHEETFCGRARTKRGREQPYACTLWQLPCGEGGGGVNLFLFVPNHTIWHDGHCPAVGGPFVICDWSWRKGALTTRSHRLMHAVRAKGKRREGHFEYEVLWPPSPLSCLPRRFVYCYFEVSYREYKPGGLATRRMWP